MAATTKKTETLYAMHRIKKGQKLADLFATFERLGPIKNFHVETDSEDETMQLAKVCYSHMDPTTSSATQLKEDSDKNRTIYKVTRKDPPVIKSTVVVNSRLQKKKDPKRLYCLLPWKYEENEREEKFLEHFLQFGPLEYHEVVADRKGRLAYGYVQYEQPRNAKIALTNCDRLYKPRIAEERTIPLDKQSVRKTMIHKLCGKMIDEIIYPLHDRTCRLRHELETKRKDRTRLRKERRTPERSYNQRSSKLKGPYLKPTEQKQDNERDLIMLHDVGEEPINYS